MADALRERQLAYGLSLITIIAEPGITLAPPDPLRFCREVVPLLQAARPLARLGIMNG